MDDLAVLSDDLLDVRIMVAKCLKPICARGESRLIKCNLAVVLTHYWTSFRWNVPTLPAKTSSSQ